MRNKFDFLGYKKGFTLVELLVVIVIIGVLAGMMMLSTGKATDKAEAAKIINDLRTIKAAALMYYADTGVVPGGDPATPGNWKSDAYWTTELKKYLPNGYTKYARSGTENVAFAHRGPSITQWLPKSLDRSVVYIGFAISGTDNAAYNKKFTTAVKKILTEQAKQVGLYGGDMRTILDNNPYYDYTNNNKKYIFMRLK